MPESMYEIVPAAETQRDQGAGMLDAYVAILGRRKGAIASITLAGLALGILAALVQAPVYRARASVEIEGVNENYLNIRDVDPSSSYSAADTYVQTQVKVLQSEALLRRVIDASGLQKVKEGPTNMISRWIQARSDWVQSLHLPLLKPLSPEQKLVAELSENMTIRPAMATRLVEVFYESKDAQRAAMVANSTVTEYISHNRESRWNSAQQTQEWLTAQLSDLKNKLQRSGQELQEYSQRSGILIPSSKEKESMAEEKLRQLQIELSRAQAERVEKQSIFETASSAPLESLPSLLNAGPLREYQLNLSELRRQRAQMSASLTPAHYKIERLDAQVTEIEKALQKEWVKTLALIRNDYDTGLKREKLLLADFGAQSRIVADQASKAVHYNILRREADTSQQLYDSMLQKVKEASLASAMHATNIRIVDMASVPSIPYKPKLPLHAGIGGLAGIALGCIVALSRDRSARTFIAPGGVDGHFPFPQLGVIPSAEIDPAQKYAGKQDLAIMPAGDLVELVTWRRRPSLLADSFRATVASLMFSFEEKRRPRVISFTSVGPKEGKTTVVSNLGIAMAEIRSRILLIDGDLRRPRLSTIFNLTNSWGLSDLLRGTERIDEMPLEALVRTTEIPGIFVLPSGPASANVSGLFHSARMESLIARFRRDFDMVLIDSPPMFQFPDARILGKRADGVILVTRAHTTSVDSCEAAYHQLVEDRTTVLGNVVNNWNPRKSGKKIEDYYRHYFHA